jgi:hypothetical protein
MAVISCSDSATNDRHEIRIVREMSVAFRSAKAAFFVSFAERKTTILAPAEKRFGEMCR